MRQTYFLFGETTFFFEKNTYPVGRRHIIFRSEYAADRGPDHWAIFAQQECLSKETLSLANPGRGLPSPQGLFPPAKLRTLGFSATKIWSSLCKRYIACPSPPGNLQGGIKLPTPPQSPPTGPAHPPPGSKGGAIIIPSRVPGFIFNSLINAH